MKRRAFRYEVACLTTLIVAAGAGWGAPFPTSGIVEYEVQVTPRSGPPQKIARTIWFKGDKYRLEETLPAMQAISVTRSPSGSRKETRQVRTSKSVTIGSAEGTFALIPGSNEAMKFPRPPTPPGARAVRTAIPGVPFGDLNFVRQHFKKVGSEKVGRYPADIYAPNMPKMNMRPGAQKLTPMAYQVWVTPSLPVPVKMVMKGPNLEQLTLLKSARFNVPIPASLFQLPKGTKVRAIQPRPFIGGPARVPPGKPKSVRPLAPTAPPG